MNKMLKYQVLYALFILSCSLVYAARDQTFFNLPYFPTYGENDRVVSCGSQYRDSSKFYCSSCPSNQEIDPDTIGGDKQYEGCRCQLGFATVNNDCSTNNLGNCVSKSCTSCADQNEVSYSDRSACVPCGNTTLGIVNRECQCNSNEVLVERNQDGSYSTEKQCVPCGTGLAVITTNTKIAGKSYTADAYTCQSCPDPLMSMSVTSTNNYVCTCPSGYTIVGVASIGVQSCVLTTLTANFKNNVISASQVTYYDSAAAGTISSLTFQHYYLKAASHCTYYGTPTDAVYCHQLANLCVLQLYDSNSQACIDHLAVVTARASSYHLDITNWVYGGNPWLYFGGTDANAVCTTNAYRKRVTLSELFVRYVLVSYYMNGTFAGYENVGSQFSYCGRDAPYTDRGGGDSRSTEWLIFGNNEKTSFSCSLETLLGTEQKFYELFIYRQYQEYTPVPIRITNLKHTTTSTSGNTVNMKIPTVPLCDTDDILVRRFFLYDTSSGITSQSSTDRPEVIRYASNIQIEASLVTDKFARIYAPVVTITYKEVKPSSFKTTIPTTDRINFSMSYTMNMSVFDSNFRIFFIIIMVFTGLFFALRYRNWQRRNSRVVTSAVLTTDLGGFNMSTLLEMCLIASNTWVLVFFPVMVCISWYFFVFFKIQTAPSVLLPPENNIYSTTSPYYIFVVNMHVLAFFQLFYVIVLVYRQCKADLFFIDWEPLPTKAAGSAGTAKSTVSVWRSILVANEWTELQTARKTDIRFTLFFLGFVLLGMNEEYNATMQPSLENKSPGHRNIVLRFANTTFYWLLFSYGQYAWKFFCAERFFGEPPERLFVDFCTIAKISVIVLDERYHGYYLHCRSPHQFADGTMTELVSMLHKEEAGLTVDRSLEGAPADVQTFQIFMSGEWRESFDKIRDNLVGAESVSEVMNDNRNRAMSRASARQSGGGASNRGRAGTSSAMQSLNNLPSDKVLKAWKEMLVFLQEFVENNFGKAALRRVVREPTYYEKLTNGVPELSVPDQPSVFFTDREFNYCKVWFLGRELELLSLNILSYSLFDLWFGNTATSILLTYLLDLGVCYIRHTFGRELISRKTLIDNRFLI